MSLSDSQQHLRVAQQLRSARQYHQKGDLGEALQGYKGVLEQQPEHPDALYLMGLVMYRLAKPEQAVALVERATRVDPGHALSHASLAQIYQDQGEHKRALVYFKRAAQLSPKNPNIFNGLGLSLFHLDKVRSAQTAFERAIELQPDQAEAHNNLGNLFRAQDRLKEAHSRYVHCLSGHPEFIQAHNNLGVLYQQQQQPEQAVKCFEAALSLDSEYAEARNNLGAVLVDQRKISQALTQFEYAIAIDPQFSEALINAGMAMQNLGQHPQARKTLGLACRLDPENLTARWARCVAELESIYATPPAIEDARRAYQQHLSEFLQAVDLNDPAQQRQAVAMVGSMQPFLLPYQGRNDVQLQSLYGDFLCRVMEDQVSIPDAQSRQSSTIRVGMVSAFFYDHSNWKIPIRGWLKALADQYELIVYYTGTRVDPITDQARSLVSQFHSGLSARQFAQRIQHDAVDVLIYPEVGMHPVTSWLATQRLAKVQCTSWGHPVTSGLPSMDYFISSDLMEPREAAAHYREKLIRLPGLSFSWAVPQYENVGQVGCSYFGLSETDIVYLCVQNLSKYLPQYDYMLVDIARQVPNARFTFIEAAPAITAALHARLQACFAEARLDSEAHLCFIPRLNREKYHALNCLADVFLDTPEWSGCNSTLEALVCDVPVVTLAGNFMRGRHGEAIYRKMEYHQLIARNEPHYIELAVRLGNDHSWRKRQAMQIADCKYRLIEDVTPALALAKLIPELIAAQ